MPSELANLLNLDLAWRRAKADLPHRVFVEHPFETQLIESDVSGWLDYLKTDIAEGRFRPTQMVICDVPKPNGGIRPGAHLGTNDRIVYAACVGACLPAIQSSLSWSQGSVDFSYQLSSDANDVEWLKNEFNGWKNFQSRSLELAGEGFSHVLITDITGFYEHIVLDILISDLRQVSAPAVAINQLSQMLNRWNEVPGRGLPQGHAPSDILAKVYLDTVDRMLSNSGHTHLRYVDDIRVFCHSVSEAKSALLQLSQILRRRGLSLQTAKTEILSVEKAHEKIEGITKVLIDVRDRFLSQVREFFDATGYLPLSEAEELLESNTDDPDETPIQVIREAFSENYLEEGFEIEGNTDRFQKTLFHFLLNRLGKANDAFAYSFCIDLLSTQPQETGAILTYLQRINSIASSDEEISAFLDSENTLYPYQLYQIAKWRLTDDMECSESLKTKIRQYAFDMNQPSYVRSAYRALLSKNASTDDLERFMAAYQGARDSLEQCELICCLRRMERGRRNSFAGRFRDDSELHHRAYQLLQQ